MSQRLLHTRSKGPSNVKFGDGARSGAEMSNCVTTTSSNSISTTTAAGSRCSDRVPLSAVTPLPSAPRVSFTQRVTLNAPSSSATGVEEQRVASDGCGEHPLPLLSNFCLSPQQSLAKSANSSTTSSYVGKRPMTLLERRNNKDRSAMSISCLSGLSIETIQESIPECPATMDDAAPKPLQRGWSKLVSSTSHLIDAATPAPQLPRKRPCGALSKQAVKMTCTPSATSARVDQSSTVPASMAALSPECTTSSSSGTLKLLSYNILASRLVSTDRYPHCAPHYLSEEYRLQLMKEELSAAVPDILLLEELSVQVFEEKLGPFLSTALHMSGNHAVITNRDGTPRCTPQPLSSPVTSTQPRAPTRELRRFSADAGIAALGDGGSAKRPHTQLPLLASRSSERLHRSSCQAGMGRDPRPRGASTRGLSSHYNSISSLSPAAVTEPHDEDAVQRSNSALAPSSFVSHGTSGATDDYGGINVVDAVPPTPRAAKRVSVTNAEPAPGPISRRVDMEGVGIFYRRDRFQLLESVPVYFNQLAAAEAQLTDYERKKLLVDSHNVALISVLQDTSTMPPRIYIVAAVHLIWQRVEAQLWQAHHLMERMEQLKVKYSNGTSPTPVMAKNGNQSSGAAPTPALSATHPVGTVGPPISTLPCSTNGHSNGLGGSQSKVPDSPRHCDAGSILSRAEGSRDGGNTLKRGHRDSPLVSCIIGGDFNAERADAVLQYFTTGVIPAGAPVYGYWNCSCIAEAPLEKQNRRDGHLQSGRDTVSSSSSSSITGTSPSNSPVSSSSGTDPALSEERLLILRARRTTESPPPCTPLLPAPGGAPMVSRSPLMDQPALAEGSSDALITLLDTQGGGCLPLQVTPPRHFVQSLAHRGKPLTLAVPSTMLWGEPAATTAANSGPSRGERHAGRLFSSSTALHAASSSSRAISPEMLAFEMAAMAEESSMRNYSNSRTTSEFGSVLSGGAGPGYVMHLAHHSEHTSPCQDLRQMSWEADGDHLSTSGEGTHVNGVTPIPPPKSRSGKSKESHTSSTPMHPEYGPFFHSSTSYAASAVEPPPSQVESDSHEHWPHHAAPPSSTIDVGLPLPTSSITSIGSATDGTGAVRRRTKVQPSVSDVSAKFIHHLRLRDAYGPYCRRHPNRVSAVNPSTNMEGKVLDHILYEEGSMVCCSVLRLGELVQLPTGRIPSDHYMIGSVLAPLSDGEESLR